MILVAIVTYNGLEWIEHLLQPFLDDREGLEIAVVDNASTDGTPQAIAKQYPFVQLHTRPSNLGFGAANNLLMEQVQVSNRYQGIFLLNQDASITASAIRALAHYAQQHPSIGILSPRHLASDGTTEPGFAHYLTHTRPATDSDHFTEVPFINAALWYLPRHTLLEVGLFSPLFYHYGEDLDYAHRTRHHDLKVGYLPHITAYHYRPNTLPSPEKALRLKAAYHLAQAINPLLSPFQRWRKGRLAPLAEALTARGERRKALLQIYRNLAQRGSTLQLWLHRPPLDLSGLQRSLARQDFAPVLLLLYNRPRHTERILSQLLQQPEITHTPIYIWSDGAKTAQDEDTVAEVRTLSRHFCQRLPHASLHYQERNVGLAHNVVQGVTETLRLHGKVIVLEDDLSLSPYLLRWMNDALALYQDRPEVAHIHAGTFYTNRRLHNNHPLCFAGSWGWATWSDRWEALWQPDGTKLQAAIAKSPLLVKRFGYGGFMDFNRMLRQQIKGRNNSWAIRWHASLLLHHKVSINAQPPLVTNQGFDGTGTHSGGGGRYHTPVAPYPLYAKPAEGPVEESAEALKILYNYYRRTNNKAVKGWYKLKEICQ